MFVGFDTTLILPQRDGQLIQLSIRIVKGLSTFLTRRSIKKFCRLNADNKKEKQVYACFSFCFGVNVDIMCYQGQYINTLKLAEISTTTQKKDLPALTPTDLRY